MCVGCAKLDKMHMAYISLRISLILKQDQSVGSLILPNIPIP